MQFMKMYNKTNNNSDWNKIKQTNLLRNLFASVTQKNSKWVRERKNKWNGIKWNEKPL